MNWLDMRPFNVVLVQVNRKMRVFGTIQVPKIIIRTAWDMERRKNVPFLIHVSYERLSHFDHDTPNNLEKRSKPYADRKWIRSRSWLVGFIEFI